MKIFDPENTESGEYLYAFVSVQDNGKMGIVARMTESGEWMPAAFLGEHLIEKFKPHITAVARLTEKEVKLCRYKLDEIMETIEKC